MVYHFLDGAMRPTEFTTFVVLQMLSFKKMFLLNEAIKILAEEGTSGS